MPAQGADLLLNVGRYLAVFVVQERDEGFDFLIVHAFVLQSAGGLLLKNSFQKATEFPTFVRFLRTLTASNNKIF